MNEFDKALRYIFVLSFILIILAYFAGTRAVLGSASTALTNLINTSTGRTSQGTFAAYPTGG